VTLHTHLVGGQIGGQIGGQMITDRQREVLNLILQNNKISRKEIAERLEIAEYAIQKHIKALTNHKVLRRVGTKNGYWIIERQHEIN
jgi:ATP-dependent DNA helicase RecG